MLSATGRAFTMLRQIEWCYSVNVYSTSYLFHSGAQSVLGMLWPVQNTCLQKFYHHLYMNLSSGMWTAQAVKTASTQVGEDERFEFVQYVLAHLEKN